MEMEKLFTNSTFDREITSKVYKEHKTPTNQIIKLKVVYISKQNSTDESERAEKHKTKCSISLAIREIQIKIMFRFSPVPVRIAKNKHTSGAKGTLFHCGWECKLVHSLCKSMP